MARIPLAPAGTPGVADFRNPTLIPNFDRSVASGAGTVDHQSPAVFLANNPRVDATLSLVVGGTITNGNTPAITITCAALPGGSITFTYPVVTADTTTTVAEGFAKLINDSATAQNEGIYADLGGTGAGTTLVIHYGGPVGNQATLSSATLGTITLTPSSGSFSGGSGPVMAMNNFTYAAPGGSVQNYWYGQMYNLGNDLIAAMVRDGMPIG